MRNWKILLVFIIVDAFGLKFCSLIVHQIAYDTGYGPNRNCYFWQNSRRLCKNHEKFEIIFVSILVDAFGRTFCTVIVYYISYYMSYKTYHSA